MLNFHLKNSYFTSLTTITPFLLLLFLNHVESQASMEPVPTDISHHRWNPSFAITAGAVLCLLFFLGIVFFYIRNCVESRIVVTRTNATDCPCSCSQGINKELLNTFPILFYSTIKDVKTDKGPLECAVCLTDFKEQDTLRLLPKCNHVFHPQCIDSWLASHVTCPVCRANLNQDSCQVAMTIPTNFNNNDQTCEESSETVPEITLNDTSNDQNQNQNPNQSNYDANKGESINHDDGHPSKLKLLRSNSTGHSLVEQVKCVERYTLMLPEDVRRYILVNHRKSFQLSMSNNMVKGLCWSDNEGINGDTKVEKWVLCAKHG